MPSKRGLNVAGPVNDDKVTQIHSLAFFHCFFVIKLNYLPDV